MTPERVQETYRLAINREAGALVRVAAMIHLAQEVAAQQMRQLQHQAESIANMKRALEVRGALPNRRIAVRTIPLKPNGPPDDPGGQGKRNDRPDSMARLVGDVNG